MNIIDRIEAAKPNFTKSDELIYNCIKEDYWIIIREASTIVDLAEKCRVSKSAILRFAKKLGYSGYSEFKYDFSLVGHSSVPEEVHESKFDYILDSYTLAIKNIRQYLKEQDFITLAKKVLRAKKIRLCGYNRSGFTAMQFKYRLINIDIESEVVTDTLMLNMLASSSAENEIFFFFTVRGISSTPLNAFIQTCYETKKTVVVVTMNPNTIYKKYATHFILLPNIKVKGVFLDEQAIFHIFIEILVSYISERLLIEENQTSGQGS